MRQGLSSSRRDYMVERMNSIEGVSCIKPHGAFYVMMNIEKLIGQDAPRRGHPGRGRLRRPRS